jgi:membrane protein required for colicin V production
MAKLSQRLLNNCFHKKLNTADIILIVLLVAGAISGYKTGLILELISIIAFILAILGGFKLLHVGMEYVSKVYDGFGTLLPFVAFLVLFVLIIILVNTVGKILKKIIDWTPLGFFDNIFGAVLGVLKWALAISIVIWVVSALHIDFAEEQLSKSRILPITNRMLTSVGDFISTIFPSFEDYIKTLKALFENFAT